MIFVFILMIKESGISFLINICLLHKQIQTFLPYLNIFCHNFFFLGKETHFLLSLFTFIVMIVIVLLFECHENYLLGSVTTTVTTSTTTTAATSSSSVISTKKTGWRSCLAHQKHMLHKRLINRQLHHCRSLKCMCICLFVYIFSCI